MSEDAKEKRPRKEPLKILTFRAPRIVEKQLAELSTLWGENVTQVIHRAVALAHEREFGKRKKPS